MSRTGEKFQKEGRKYSTSVGVRVWDFNHERVLGLLCLAPALRRLSCWNSERTGGRTAAAMDLSICQIRCLASGICWAVCELPRVVASRVSSFPIELAWLQCMRPSARVTKARIAAVS